MFLPDPISLTIAFKLRPIFAATFAVVLFSLLLPIKPAPCRASPLAAAADFSLTGLDSEPHKLSSFSGEPVVLFFFCGCDQCHDTARNWAIEERTTAPAKRTSTIIVYAGGADEATRFLKQTGLDPVNTTILLDKTLYVSSVLYSAEPCPRVFVLSAKQWIVYTNSLKPLAAQRVTGRALVYRVVSALSSATEDRLGLNPGPAVSSSELQKQLFLTPTADVNTSAKNPAALSEAIWDFGTVKQGAVKIIQHVFLFQNNTGSPIEISRIQPSCGCTNAFVNDTADLPISIGPGATVRVTAFIDLTNLYPSKVEKSILIFRPDRISPVASIKMTGNIDPNQ